MRNLLVPTDFSASAHEAAIFAALLAKQLKARLVLFHVLPLCGQAIDELDPEAKAQASLDALAFELHSLYQISLTRLMRHGDARDEIPQMASRIQANLVVMGACGAHQTLGNGVGAVAAEMLKKADIPLVCVPAGLPISLLSALPGLELIPKDLCTAKGLQQLEQLVKKDKEQGFEVV